MALVAVVFGDTLTVLIVFVAVATFKVLLEAATLLEAVLVTTFVDEADALCTLGAYCRASTPAVAPKAAINTMLVAYAPSNFFLGFEIGLEGIVITLIHLFGARNIVLRDGLGVLHDLRRG